MIISNVSIRNRVTVAVLVLLISLAGAYSYVTLPRESAPDVPIPYILVTTTYQGVAPEEMENSVTRVIESKLTGIKGLKEVRSSSFEGLSSILVEFTPDIRIEDALQYVRDKVEQAKGDLSKTEADAPVVTEINISEFPIMSLSISGNISPVTLKDIGDKLQDAIEQNVPGVLNVNVLGGLEREIRIEMDPQLVAWYNLTIPEVMSLIPGEHVNVSAGGTETPGIKFNVRVPGEFKSEKDIQDIAHLPIAKRGDSTIFLGDVATVRDTFKDRQSISRLDGQESITLTVQKRVGANILEIAAGVKRVVAEAKKRAPQGVNFTLTMDRSDDIKLMVADLENNIGAALVLVVAVLLVSIGFRASMVVALAVPLSMLMSFALLQMMGYTLNMIVLFSLVLAVGMLVDDAIVIVENVYRHMQMGYGRIEAAMKGTSEVAWPVITSTFTTCAAFLPLLFWPGIMGSFFKYLPVTLIVTLMSSLFVAMVVSPVVCTLVPGKVASRDAHHPILRAYRKLLRLAVEHRVTTLALAVMLLVGVAIFYGKRGLGMEFMPNIDPKHGIVNIRGPQGTNITQSDRLALAIEARLAQRRKADGILQVVTNVGSGGQDIAGALFGSSSAAGPHAASLTLVYPKFEERVKKSADSIKEIRAALKDIPGAEIKVEKEPMGPPTGAAVTIRIIGEDLNELQKLSEKATGLIRDVPGMVNLRSDLELAKPELVFRPERISINSAGLSTKVVGQFLQTCLMGSKVGTFRQGEDEYDITVRLPLAQRSNIDELANLQIPNTTGQPVPLSSLGKFELKKGLGTINRVNQKRVITLTADAEGRLGPDLLKDVQKILAGGLKLPEGYEVKYVGENEEMEKANTFLSKAFVVGLILITLIMVAQFNTLSVPMVIMTTVVLSLIGVLSGLLACQMPFGLIMTGLGVICLAGVVVKNGIVLMDYTRKLQAGGMDVITACVEAGAIRLRPVLLTAACTVLGLVPTALGMSYDFHTLEWVTKSESSAWWKPMAVAVIFGLSFATILTLVVVPCLYVLLYRAASKLGLGGIRTADRMPEDLPVRQAGRKTDETQVHAPDAVQRQ